MTVAERIRAMRAELLDKAVEDAIQWGSNPDKSDTERRVSDQFWFRLFSGERTVDLGDGHKFLVTFQLTRMRTWDKQQVADLINGFASQSDFVVHRDVPVLAEALGGCITSKNSSPQTSAASKIAMFAKPTASVFIWDQLAMRSARLRDGVPDVHREYRDANKRHDYPAFASACARTQAFETRQADFQKALDCYCDAILTLGGPMSKAPREFMERRLLDKLMFWEGWHLREWRVKQAA